MSRYLRRVANPSAFARNARPWYADSEHMGRYLKAEIDAFLSGETFAVAGASASRHKYGNRVLRHYWQRGLNAVPINPNHDTVEGARCYPQLSDVPHAMHGVSLITQPAVSESVVDDALRLGIRHLWFQPGSEHRGAIERARQAGAVVIADGSCVLVELR